MGFKVLVDMSRASIFEVFGRLPFTVLATPYNLTRRISNDLVSNEGCMIPYFRRTLLLLEFRERQ